MSSRAPAQELQANWAGGDGAEETPSPVEPGEDASEAGALSDATQLYLHQIGLNRLFTPE